MTTYRNIHGRAIQAITTDPSESVAEGQIWYNTSSDTFKSIVASEAFSSGAPLATGRAQGSGAGTQTTALFVGGRIGPPGDTTACENYNGTGWSSIPSLNTARQYAGGCGTETSALTYGDYPATTTTEEFNGSAWSAQEGFSTARRSGASFGLETAAVLAGGSTGPAVTTATEEYNGEAWTGGGALSQARQYFAGTGIESAGLAFGGSSNPNTTIYANTEEYNGSSWTSGGAMPAVRSMMFSWGTQSAAALSGGALPSTTNTCLKYDGTSWTASPATMGTATKEGYTSGVGTTQSAGLCAGGDPGISRTEEFTSSANVITAGAWASGGNLNTARYSLGGFGATQDTAVAFVGRDTPIYNATEEYNGNTWTTVNNYPQSVNDPGSCGVLTAGLGLGGLYPTDIGTFPTTGRVTAEYDGTNWTAGGSYTYDSWGSGMAGIQTAAIASGGHNYPMPPGNRNNSAEYNGSSWTAGNNMSQVRAIFSAGGSQTASFACGGRSSPGVEDPTNLCEEYDGTNWTTGGNYIVAVKENTAGGGPQTAGYVAGGSAPTATSITGTYDGTAWSTAANLPGNQQNNGGTSNNTGPSNAMSFGGGTDKDATYEFNQESTALNVKTLTQS